ncbi:MAG: nitrilase-related carbon-nitrogen hydrolase [Pseudomonadota bacterium]
MTRFSMFYAPVFLALVLAGCSPAADTSTEQAVQAAAAPKADAVPAADSVPELVRPDGSYPTVPLEKDTIVVKVVQNGVKNLQDFDDVREGLKENLERMVSFAERACSEGKKPDFILFNEFPLTGYSSGSRYEKLKFTLEIPGPETDRLGEVAQDCDSYLIFGSYARDEAWPGHILSINAVIGRDGSVVKRYWKTRNVKRLGPTTEIPTTTIEGVRAKYRERYGIEEEFPVLMTEYGNIAVSTVQLDPFVFAAYAMRGTEIMFRTSTLFSPVDVRATALYNNFYTAMSNITFPADSDWASYGGKSLIAGPDGKVLAEDPSNNESIIEAEIPIAEFREGRTLQRYPLEVVAPVFDQYVVETPLDHLDLPPEELPPTGEDMKTLIDETSRWLN